MKTKVLIVIFDLNITPWEITAFRSSIISTVGLENILFHNHIDQGFLYGYPVIQYKIIGANAAMVCVNEGSEEIIKFFQKTNWKMRINQRIVSTQVKSISYTYFDCELSDLKYVYCINDWFALNETNFEVFKNFDSDDDKRLLLQRILVGNILSFAKAIRWTVEGEIKIEIRPITRIQPFQFKGQQMVGFDAIFSTNALLPDYIGLGKLAARGFGALKRIPDNDYNKIHG